MYQYLLLKGPMTLNLSRVLWTESALRADVPKIWACTNSSKRGSERIEGPHTYYGGVETTAKRASKSYSKYYLLFPVILVIL